MPKSRIVSTVALIALLIVACSPETIETPTTLPLETEEAKPTEIPATPSPDTSRPEPQATEPSGSQPDEVILGKVLVDKIEIMLLESFPVQVHVIAAGSLPDACTTVDQVSQERIENGFQITITTIRPADKICADLIVEYEQLIPLDVVDLPAGRYFVDVNGVSDTFELAADNMPLEEPTEGEVIIQDAVVERVRLDVTEKGSFQVSAVVDAFFRDGCSELDQVIQDHGEGIVEITLTTARPADEMCAQVLVPFQEIVPLDLDELPAGVYEVLVNGASGGTFQIPTTGNKSPQ